MNTEPPFLQAFEIPEKYKNAAKILHNHCLEKTKADEEVLRQCANRIIPDDPVTKCYIHCIFDSVGLIDENGQIDLVSVAQTYYPELVDAAKMFHNECPIPRKFGFEVK